MTPKRSDRRPVIVTLGRPGAPEAGGVEALRALGEVRLHATTSPEAAAAALRSERAALAVVASGAPERWVDELLAASPRVPLLALVEAGQATPARWTQAGVATLQVPASILALARIVTLLLEGRAVRAAP
ncbi:MAG TPA: hypothetical protein VFP50_12200 [Anaeromyxobacteraceae bacterium]|nr:hypothetical protein [Anaeromyxobacteraceae bacterium]